METEPEFPHAVAYPSAAPPSLAHAATEASEIPPELLGIDLGPPIGPLDPTPAGELDPEEDTGQFEFALTEAQHIPASLLRLDLEATTDEVPIRPAPRRAEDIASAATEAAEIPELLRGIDLGGDD